jgi:predicted RNA-binding protein YlxR (DUF448 family)
MARRKPDGQVHRKHVPQRTCVVCRKTLDKRMLVRIVNTPDEGVVVDLTGKRNGRGAYICREDACWQQALTTNVLEHALRISLTDEDRVRLHDQRPQF